VSLGTGKITIVMVYQFPKPYLPKIGRKTAVLKVKTNAIRGVLSLYGLSYDFWIIREVLT
jgi:hypothetical protein